MTKKSENLEKELYLLTNNKILHLKFIVIKKNIKCKFILLIIYYYILLFMLVYSAV